MAKVLSIITSAYRGTIEEQDDTIVWLTHALRGAGAEVDVLLQDSAVNYLVRGQDASGLSFGAWRQTQPPQLDVDLARLVEKGVKLYAVREDLAERGIESSALIDGFARVGRAEVADLIDAYDRVWRW
jgi:intracellular sulfur oxidation DsrE/DsrF family protein